mmetsp:Transcript_27676/g.81337  ORF Transcript_27676/g.81337 Transcript_27676/m.81337 type:complete len:177 (-) Transcript_27676:361-891(-)
MSAATAELLHRTAVELGFAYAELWLPRFTPNGSAVLELSTTSVDHQKDSDALYAFAQESRALRFAAGYGLPGRTWTSRQPEWKADLQSVPPQAFMRGEIAGEHGLYSALGIPVLGSDNSPLAVAVFFSPQPGEVSTEVMSALGAKMSAFVEAVSFMPLLAPEAAPLSREESASDGL